MSNSHCCVGGCANRKSNDVSLHTFPKNMTQRRLWIRGIQTTRSGWNGPKMATTQLVCSMHFTLESFSSSTRTKWLLGLPCKPALNPDAVPTLFGENVRTSNIVSDVQRSTTRKREVQRILNEHTETKQQIVPSQEDKNNPEQSELEVEWPLIASDSVKTLIDGTEPAIQLELQDEEVDLNNNSGSFDEGMPDQELQLTAPPKKQTSAKGCQANIKIRERHSSKGTQTLSKHAVKMASVGVQCQTTNLCMSVGVQCQIKGTIRTSTPRKATPTTYSNPMDTSFQSVFSTSYEDDVTADPDFHLNQTCSTEADHEEVSNTDVREQNKYLVFEENLLELFKTCPQCRLPAAGHISQRSGSYIAIRQTCECGFSRRWESQPKVQDIPAGNLLLSAAILFAGCTPTKVLRLFQFMNVLCISMSTFFQHQRSLLWPAVEAVWLDHTSAALTAIKEEGRSVTLAGDGRCDSPGHCAKYGSYTFIDMATGHVIGLHLVQSNEVTSSYHMELEGLRRGLAALQEKGIQIAELVTDRHMQIQKWLRDNHPEIKHSYDVWHVAKAVKKKLVALSKQKDCDHLFKWIKSITNHLYWSAASSSDDDGTVIVSKWKSVSNHIQNIHHGHDGPFTDCQHEELR